MWKFKADLPHEQLATHMFQWLSDAVICAKRPNTSDEELLVIQNQLSDVLKCISEKPDVQSHSTRVAFGSALYFCSVRLNTVKHLIPLTQRLVGMVTSKKSVKYNSLSHFSVAILGYIALIPLHSLRNVCRNTFIVLTAALKALPSSNLSHTGFTRDLVWALTCAARGSGRDLDLGSVKYAFKQARALSLDSSARVATCAFELLEVLASPDMVGSKSKFEKLTSLYHKGIDSQYRQVRKAAARFYARLVTDLETIEIDADDELGSQQSNGGQEIRKSKMKITLRYVLKSQGEVYRSADTSARVAAGIAEFFGQLLLQRDSVYIRKEYPHLVASFVAMASGVPVTDEYRLVLGVRHVKYLVADIISREILTSEQALLDCTNVLIRLLVNSGRDNHLGCVAIVHSLKAMILQLDNAVTSLSDSIHQACIALMENTTQWSLSIALVECLYTLVTFDPKLLLPLTSFAQQKLSAFPSTHYAYLLAGLIYECDRFPHYASMEVLPNALNTALSSIKQGQSGHPAESFTKMHVGWIIIEGFFRLGPQIVKLHLAQLLLLVKTFLSRPRKAFESEGELLYLLKTRTLALGGLAALLSHNKSLITVDVAHQLASMLHNVWNFVDESRQAYQESAEVQSCKLDAIRRIMECHAKLSKAGGSEIHAASLMTTAVYYALDPGFGVPKTSTNKIVEDVFSTADNLARGLSFRALLSPSEDDLALQPILASYTFDADQLLIGGQALPPRASIVEESISVLASNLPLQPARVQESLLDRVRSYLESYTALSVNLKSDSSRTQSAHINASMLLKELMSTTTDPVSDMSLTEPRNARIILDILNFSLQSKFEEARHFGADAYGGFFRRSDQAAVANSFKDLTDKILGDVNPFHRHGYLLAVTAIFNQAGNKLSSNQAQAMMSYLLSLAKDPHPYVHTAAIEAIGAISANSGFLASNFAKSALSNLGALYCLDTHTIAASTVSYNNMALKYSASLAIVKCCSVMVSLLGPDLISSPELYRATYRLLHELQLPTQPDDVIAQSWLSFQEIFYVAKSHVDWVSIVVDWCNAISKSSPGVKARAAALEALTLLFKTSPSKAFAIAGRNLESQLWLALDHEGGEAWKRLFWVWLDHTAQDEPGKWITRIKDVTLRPREYYVQQLRAAEDETPPESAEAADKANGIDLDEEGQSLGLQAEKGNTELLNWKTRQFSCQLLLKLIKTELRSKSLATLRDSVVAKMTGEIVKIAFFAATSSVQS